jgi:fructose-bisphosphate aldolase class I
LLGAVPCSLHVLCCHVVLCRFKQVGVSNSLANRAAWRKALLTTPDFNQYISGVILTEETLYQTLEEPADSSNSDHSSSSSSGGGGSNSCDGADSSSSDGGSSSSSTADAAKPQRLIDVLLGQGIAVGVKVDQGVAPLHPDAFEFPSASQTKGLDGLLDRCKNYAAAGATFAKWRAVLRVDETLGWPTDAAVALNVRQLAEYALVAQQAGLVPIVEPEVLVMEGDHGLGLSEAASARVLAAVVGALLERGVLLEGVVLKPAMVLPGSSSSSGEGVSAAGVAAATIRVLRRTIPPAIPGIAFLSGGQSEQQAAENLAAIKAACDPVSNRDANCLADSSSSSSGCSCPWVLTFSFGRALQASALAAWARDPQDIDSLHEVVMEVAAGAAAPAVAGHLPVKQ